ncbi:hypothetical protein PMG11_01140 [Penicillium brasilianum]|uniref:Receptor-activated Ca2+-permeable cation channel n=1 Tax=Penicillium brasilianum TaxID=104259 RepID=A0A0F7TH62_PENBI|nr:hypothetical protein PMG11_01140 [Penicillium brasilianum]
MDRYSDTLLDDETIDEDGPLNIGESGEHPRVDPHANLPVYRTIHRIRRLITTSIDDPYTSEQLRDPQMNLRIVRPLVDQLYDSEDVSTVYCLIVNRAQFLREQHYQGHLQTVNITRATLCEILASRVLRRFDEDNSGPAGLLLLANILVAGFEPFQNAPETITRTRPNAPQWPVQKRGGYERKITALEVAIISESKTLLSSSACQKVVDAVYRGQIIYTPLSFVDIIPDHYKHHPISLYNPRKSPILNHRRLIVPRLRNIIEICQFAVLLLLYGLTMVYRDGTNITTYETIFCTYASGWLLEEFAAIIEHGWYVHTQNVWSFLDIAFFGIYSVYFMLRTYAAVVEDVDLATSSLDILCVAAPVLLPRLAFNLMPDNMLFISLRAMMRDFSVLTLLATWCFAGFFLSMKWLIESRSEIVIDLPGSATISKWMLWIWFGLDGTGFERSPDFHVLLGPALMIAFAFLGNTLFLTVLVSMLTNTFAKMVENSTAQVHFRRAVLTFEGVKSDAIFAYRPPLNILALVILLPLKFVLSPRWFHKVNVGAARVLNAPLLLAIGLYEQHQLWQAPKNGTKKLYKRTSLLPWTFSGFSPHGDIQAVFDIEPPKNVFS